MGFFDLFRRKKKSNNSTEKKWRYKSDGITKYYID